MKAAILVDGGYYRKIALAAFGQKSPKDTAIELVTYCMRHLHEQRYKRKIHYELYRIFYYDCPPLENSIYNPLLDKAVNMKNHSHYKWMNEFLKELTKKRKLALRLGKQSYKESNYTLKYDSVKKLMKKKITVEDLTDQDFYLTSKQKGVDMKIGVDIASLSYKKQVDKIILIAGDSDFVPASKLARREGIDFVLDSLGRGISEDLFEHIDGLRFCDNRLKENYKQRT
ncbi:MAG: NYN domain-containing protein [Bacillota bacterium]|nr:NYN domain-containing protein [Bacillota bacterium]